MKWILIISNEMNLIKMKLPNDKLQNFDKVVENV